MVEARCFENSAAALGEFSRQPAGILFVNRGRVQSPGRTPIFRIAAASSGISGKRAFPCDHGPAVGLGCQPSSMIMKGLFLLDAANSAMRAESSRMSAAELFSIGVIPVIASVDGLLREKACRG